MKIQKVLKYKGVKMNKEEIYISLLKAKENIVLYNKEKFKNKNWNGFKNGIIEKLDDVILSFSTLSEMDIEEIRNCFFEVGANNKNSIYYDKDYTPRMKV